MAVKKRNMAYKQKKHGLPRIQNAIIAQLQVNDETPNLGNLEKLDLRYIFITAWWLTYPPEKYE